MQYNFNEHCHTSPMLDEILHMEIRRVRRSVEEHFILFFPHRERKKKLIKKKKKSQLTSSSFFACFDFSRFMDNLGDLSECVHSLYYLDWGNSLM